VNRCRLHQDSFEYNTLENQSAEKRTVPESFVLFAIGLTGRFDLQTQSFLYYLTMNPKTGKKAPAPQHPELKESLCDLIRKQLQVQSE
jgi:hypothetical protein